MIKFEQTQASERAILLALPAQVVVEPRYLPRFVDFCKHNNVIGTKCGQTSMRGGTPTHIFRVTKSKEMGNELVIYSE